MRRRMKRKKDPIHNQQERVEHAYTLRTEQLSQASSLLCSTLHRCVAQVFSRYATVHLPNT